MFADARARALSTLALTFLAGALAGAAVARTVPELRARSITPADTSKRPAAGDIRREARGVDSISVDRIPTPLEALGLSDDQRTRLHDIARRWRPKSATAWEEVRREVGELENGMFADMLCVLTPDQRDRYLAQLHRYGMAREVIDKRFATVRANRCAAAR